ncbi:MAG TPA: hypothetical protein VEP71_02075 [Gallionella sp.]|nr:hypothetical protein [Gallionella sp.]
MIYALKAPVDFRESAMADSPQGTFVTVGETDAVRYGNTPATADADVPKNDFLDKLLIEN